MSLKNKKSYEILKDAFERKLLLIPTYSKSILARNLGVSGAFVTQVLSGKRAIPLERLTNFFQHLELDVLERQMVLKLLLKEICGDDTLELITTDTTAAQEKVISHENTQISRKNIIEYWWTLAVYHGLFLNTDLEDLKVRLSITESQLQKSLSVLDEAQLITNENNKITPTKNHLYFPTGKSRQDIRNFHEQMISKARNELIQKTSDQDFHSRLITGFTFTANRNNIEEAKAKIQVFLSELSEQMSSGDCTDVYQCNVQLFPLTQKK